MIWQELIFHSARSGGLAVAVSLFSAVPGSRAMPPTLFGKELNYYGPHKDTKQRPTALWAAADSQPNIWWCSQIQAAAVLQHFQAPLLQCTTRVAPPDPCRTLLGSSAWQTAAVDIDTGPSHWFE